MSKKELQKYETVEKGLQDTVNNAGTAHLFLESIMKKGNSENTRMAVIYHSRVHQAFGKISVLYDMFFDDMVQMTGATLEEVYSETWFERFSKIIEEQNKNLEELIKLTKK